ncbi:hypothetical protein, partial [Porphyromonas gingivalis]|uniref:hypothetical protein n=1 Tax=Porphyromonas gingivalis TaxID=837 RepID=UPI0003AD6BD7
NCQLFSVHVNQTDLHYTQQTEPQTRKETRIQNAVRMLLPKFTLVLHLFVESAQPTKRKKNATE